MSEQKLLLTETEMVEAQNSGEPGDEALCGAQLAKAKQHQYNIFKRALEQSRKGEPLDLSEEDFELFSAIQTDGIIKAHQKRLDRPCPRCKGSGLIEVGELKGGVYKGKDIDCPDCKGTGGLDSPELREIETIIVKIWDLAIGVSPEGYQTTRTATLKWAKAKLLALIPDIEEPEWAGARHLNLDSELEEAKRIGFEDGYTKGQQHSIGTDTKLVEETKKQGMEKR